MIILLWNIFINVRFFLNLEIIIILVYFDWLDEKYYVGEDVSIEIYLENFFVV